MLRETHTEYVRTQKTLAEACAEAGDFEEMEKHLTNSCISLGGNIVIERKITDEEIERIRETGIKNTDPARIVR